MRISHKTRLIIFVCQTRGDQMSHLYSCRERESAAAIHILFSLSLARSLGACVPVREPTTATRNEPPPPNNALCSVFALLPPPLLLAAERIFQSWSKKGKNIKRSPETGCMDFELGKTSVKMAFRSLCSPDFITYRLKCVFLSRAHLVSPHLLLFIFTR